MRVRNHLRPLQIPGRFLKFCLVGPGKGGIIPESGGKAGFRDGSPLFDQIPGQEEPAVGDIAADGISGLGLEQAHHIIFADKKYIREAVNVQGIGQVGMDVVQDGDDLGVVPLRVQKFDPFLQCCPIQLDHEFQEQKLTVEAAGVFRIVEGLFQTVCDLEQGAFFQGRDPKYVGMLLLCFLKTKAQVIFFIFIIRHKAGGDIDDDPLVGHGAVHLDPVQIVFLHQHDIVRLQFISLSFYIILYVSADKDRDFMKLVIMEFIFPGQLVCQVKDAEIAVQIAFFFIVFHGNSSSNRGFTGRNCAQSPPVLDTIVCRKAASGRLSVCAIKLKIVPCHRFYYIAGFAMFKAFLTYYLKKMLAIIYKKADLGR